MTGTRSKRPSRAAQTQAQRWAELADLALVVAREISFLEYSDPRAQHLTQSEGMVMRHLLAAPAAPSQIAAATGLQRTNLSTVLRSLERKGLVERHPSLGDARGVSVHLTEAGRTNYEVARSLWGRAVRAAAGGDARSLDATLSLLATVREGLTEMRSVGPRT